VLQKEIKAVSEVYSHSSSTTSYKLGNAKDIYGLVYTEFRQKTQTIKTVFISTLKNEILKISHKKVTRQSFKFV